MQQRTAMLLIAAVEMQYLGTHQYSGSSCAADMSRLTRGSSALCLLLLLATWILARYGVGVFSLHRGRFRGFRRVLFVVEGVSVLGIVMVVSLHEQ